MFQSAVQHILGLCIGFARQRLITVFWNKRPREGFPLDWRDSHIAIDDYGDFVVVSIRIDRLIPVGRFRVASEEDIAKLIMHLSFECAVISSILGEI